MTGREMIIYILENGLEDSDVFKNGIFVGLITVDQAATKFNVGVETVTLWYTMGWISGITINDNVLIFKNAKDPRISHEK